MRAAILTMLLMVIGGTAAFVVTRRFTAGSTTGAQVSAEPTVAPAGAQATAAPTVDVDALARLVQAEAAKPRFKGELLGIYIAPQVEDYPPEVRAAYDALLGGGPCLPGSLALAGDLAFSAPTLPGSLTPASVEPGVVQCSGRVTGVGYDYTGFGKNGLPCTVLVARVVGRISGFDIPAERVGTEQIAGRAAVVARPATDDGTGQASVVVFPEPFGLTEIHAFNLSLEELRAVAGAVARAGQ